MVEPVFTQRLIVLGRNSKVWASLNKSPLLANIPIVAIGHAELPHFAFRSGDKVWVFSYSHSVNENRLLLETLARQQNISITYISSASTNVTTITRCYNYPTVKQQAQEDAVRLCAARIINIGWFYSNVTELPAGRTAATSVDELALTMQSPNNATTGHIVNLFSLVDRPFESQLEKVLYQLYGILLKGSGRYPCLLRPVDLILRMVGMRWYGYLYLSNSLWFTTI